MGYYVLVDDARLVIRSKQVPSALEALKELDTHDELKRGGSSNGAKWFSWMNNINIQEQEDLSPIFRNLGFDEAYTDLSTGDFHLGSFYDSKTGQEDLFLETVAPFVESGSFIIWRGEGGETWRNLFVDGEMYTQEGRVVFDDPQAAAKADDPIDVTGELRDRLRALKDG